MTMSRVIFFSSTSLCLLHWAVALALFISPSPLPRSPEKGCGFASIALVSLMGRWWVSPYPSVLLDQRVDIMCAALMFVIKVASDAKDFVA